MLRIQRQDEREHYCLIAHVLGVVLRARSAPAITLALHGKPAFLCRAGGRSSGAPADFLVKARQL